MITIRLHRNQNHEFTGFRISGHAEYSDPGSDIVCAGVSAVSQTALLGLLKYSPKGVTYHIDEKSGFLEVHVEECSEASQIILHTMELGLKEIAQTYHTYVVLHS